MLKPKADYLFEAAWEVCNKVGGIYTVVRSKAGITKDNYKNYFLVGPYFPNSLNNEFEKGSVPEEFASAFKEMQSKGIQCHYGTWLIKSRPSVILIDFSSITQQKNDIKGRLWDWFRIDSIRAGWDFEEPMLWATALSSFVDAFARDKRKDVLLHCHEWMSGIAILHLKHSKSKVKTVFTTHATMLGRSIAGNGHDLYAMLQQLNPDEWAYRLQVEAKYLTEKACAHHAGVFTTVSEITAIEAEKILGKKAEVLLPNGLEVKKFPTVEESLVKHNSCRDKVREFIKLYFFPYYSFDIRQNLIFFIIGRYEYRNKGIDVFINALGKLNELMKRKGSRKTVTAFFWIPAEHKGIRMDILENKASYRHLKNFVRFHDDQIFDNIVDTFLTRKELKQATDIFPEEFSMEIKKGMHIFERKGMPPLSTHHVDESDSIICGLRDANLLNRPEDMVKVVFYPVYLDGNDEMINLSYYDTIAACHFGVFPSYYEPYGYTPLESAALAVPSLTTDLSGFGRFIRAKEAKSPKGIFVLNYMNIPRQKIDEELVRVMYDFAQMDRHQRVEQKLAAKQLSELCDWRILIENYIRAHNLALSR